MLDGLRHFIADVISPTAQETRSFDDTGYRLAATALLIHVISLDGEPSEVEKRKLHSLLESRFELDPGTADQLIAAATLVEGEAVDLYHFTSVIMRSVDEEGRLRIVEMMWELVYVEARLASSRTTSSGARRTCSGCLRAIGSSSSVVSRAGNPPPSQTARISRTRQADALRSNRLEPWIARYRTWRNFNLRGSRRSRGAINLIMSRFSSVVLCV